MTTDREGVYTREGAGAEELQLGAAAAPPAAYPPDALQVTDAMVDLIGAALYIHWADVNETSRNAYRKKIRDALTKAFADV